MGRTTNAPSVAHNTGTINAHWTASLFAWATTSPSGMKVKASSQAPSSGHENPLRGTLTPWHASDLYRSNDSRSAYTPLTSPIRRATAPTTTIPTRISGVTVPAMTMPAMGIDSARRTRLAPRASVRLLISRAASTAPHAVIPAVHRKATTMSAPKTRTLVGSFESQWSSHVCSSGLNFLARYPTPSAKPTLPPAHRTVLIAAARGQHLGGPKRATITRNNKVPIAHTDRPGKTSFVRNPRMSSAAAPDPPGSRTESQYGALKKTATTPSLVE